jgi:phosphoglycerate dehydrogenase-like enzyme
MTIGPDRVELAIFSPGPATDPFAITEAIFARAAERHAEAARQVDWTVAHTSRVLEGALCTATVALAFDLPRYELERRAPRLRWMHVPAAGIDHLLPLGWLPRSVILTNSSGAHSGKAGEFAAMSLLMLNARMPFYMTNQRESQWIDHFTGSIAGKTVVIVGLGGLGTAASRAAKRLGMRTIGVRRSGRQCRGLDQVVRAGKMAEVLPEADFLYVAAPLTTETRNLLGRAELDLLRPGCGIVNVGRAAVVDYDALAQKLHSGHLSGAILDVFDQEPLPSSSLLWSTPNLVIVPHTSCTDVDTYLDNVLDRFFSNLKRFLVGRPLTNRVLRTAGY